ncbi:MAG: type I 3-dehydroquinate dehydratase [Bacteroidales bacterium]
MICLSIGTKEYKKIESALSKTDMAEIRLDLTNLSKNETIKLFQSKKALMATCRNYRLTHKESKKRLTWAILGTRSVKSNGPRYLDLDYDAPLEYREELTTAARKAGFKIILSYHNFEITESYEKLLEVYKEAVENGADIVKIVTTAHTIQECTRVIKLYNVLERERLVAFSLGDFGQFTRVLAHYHGAPFLYCTLDESSATAPGQLTISEAQRILSKKSYPHKVSKMGLLPKLTAPASKSHAQRAILAAAFSKGTTSLYGYSPCLDSEKAIALVKRLGAKVKVEKSRVPRYKLTIISEGIEALSAQLKRSYQRRGSQLVLNVGESGLLCRLMIPFAAHLTGGEERLGKIVLTGEGGLQEREIYSPETPFEELGLSVESIDRKLPLIISGPLKPGKITLSGKGGSQLLSGLLMSLPLCDKSSTIKLTEPTSVPYLDLTIKSIKDFGVIVENSDYREFKIPGKQRYKSKNFISIDGDWSGASMLIVAGAITSGVTITNLPINSNQADEKIIETLRSCGVELNITEHPRYLIMCGDQPCVLNENSKSEVILGSSIEVVKPKHPLLPFEYDATDSPDLFPTLVVLALNCDGVSKIKGIHRLANKESNRAVSLYSEFTKLGAKIDIDSDWMVIEGGELHGGRCNSHNDHRIAMAIITAALNIKEQVYLDDLECISKSFPAFLKNFK